MKDELIVYKPVIGISTNLLKITEKPFLNLERNYVNRGYVDWVVEAGGVPILLPLLSDTAILDSLLAMVDGLVITGGQDVYPSHYKELPHPLLGGTAPERDACELHLLRSAYNDHKPIFGICRGMQLLNVAFGGSLYQDLSLHKSQTSINHSQDADPDAASHSVALTPGSKLQEILGKNSISTNSFHHQAVKELAPGFAISAKSPDDVIESIERINPDSSWLLGVQWHPEAMPLSDPETTKLFNAFITEASQYRRRR